MEVKKYTLLTKKDDGVNHEGSETCRQCDLVSWLSALASCAFTLVLLNFASLRQFEHLLSLRAF